jgi:hypothetical protein
MASFMPTDPLAWPVPSRRMLLFAGVGGQVIQQFVRRILAGRVVRQSSQIGGRTLELARTYERLAEVYYFANDTLLMSIAGLRALNLSEQLVGGHRGCEGLRRE